MMYISNKKIILISALLLSSAVSASPFDVSSSTLGDVTKKDKELTLEELGKVLETAKVLYADPSINSTVPKFEDYVDVKIAEALEKKQAEEGGDTVSALPGVSMDGDGNLVPAFQVTFKDIWRHNSDLWLLGQSKFKTKFVAMANINPPLKGDDNESLMKNYLHQGGNIDFGLQYGFSFKGAENDSLSFYAKAKYSNIEAKEYDSSSAQIDLDTEILSYGLGVSVKWRSDFSMGYEVMYSETNDNETGSFFKNAVDDELIHKYQVTMKRGDNTYLQLSRVSGINGIDAEIRFSIIQELTNLF